MTKNEYKIVRLIALGGALEFYDFTIYALYAPYLSQNFFFNTNEFIGLMNTFAVFALGYLARPFGGIVFGHLGDTWGRKSAFSLAILLMATATLLMGCLPTYQSIGTLAPILLIILRLLQGFSVGGEIPGASVFTIEHVAVGQRGRAIGLVFMCITLGNTLGAGIGFLLTSLLTHQQMVSWGWRIPFIFGFVLGIISYVIRKKVVETPIFTALLKENNLHHIPFFKMLKLLPIQLLSAFLLTAVSASIVSLFLYLPTYFVTSIKINATHGYLINVFAFLSFGLFTAFFGSMSDTVNRKKLLMAASALLIVLSYPLFYGLRLFGEPFLWVFILSFALLGGVVNGSYMVLITESFPANLRYSAVGFCFSLGIAVFGGLAPLVFTWLIQYVMTSLAPAFYMSTTAALSLLALLLVSSPKNIEKGELN